MTGRALGSVAARLGVLGCTAAMVLLNARLLGAEGTGGVAVLQLGLLVTASVGGLLAGGAVVYLGRTVALRSLLGPAHGWMVLCAASAALGLPILGVLPASTAWTVAGLGWLQAVANFHGQVAVARDRVRLFNRLQLLQVALTPLFATVLYLGAGWRTPSAFAAALAAALVATVLASLAALRDLPRPGEATPAAAAPAATRLLARHGLPSSLGATLQLAANRIHVALLGASAAAGIFAVAWAGVEAVWSVARGVAPLVHIGTASTPDADQRRAATRFHLLFAGTGTLLLTALAASLPDAVYASVFGFSGIAPVLQAAAGAACAGGWAPVLSHHLSGLGLHRYNAWTSAAGLAVGTGCAVWWIPTAGAVGAGAAASVGALVQLSGLLWAYRSAEGPDALRFRRTDLRTVSRATESR